jgi:bifunctional non-homologous end joining protein LigD
VCPFDPVPAAPGAHWVVPRLVGEVRYSTRTRAGMLRQPSWQRLRPDLAPEDSAADLPDHLPDDSPDDPPDELPDDPPHGRG